ncbi:MAG: MATE family efflux transporter [Acholeplasmatales bacterium]|nr:MATE family efflux transporter [Acholeplasmatales bacterium]
MNENKMGRIRMNKLIWTMGLPMILSMVLQAIYNVVDTIFVINMGSDGYSGNLALTAAFPIQILIIAIGVGTGVGINAMLSMNLGKGDKKMVDKTAGNGIFLALCIYLVFLLFGLFLAKPYMSIMSSDSDVIEMGVTYLRICTCLSLGSIGYTVYERFLQSTGKTLYSTISQISGAVINIVLDYIFIYPLGMGVAGAAFATVIGQFISLFVAMAFHYLTNKEIGNNPKNIVPSGRVIGLVYKIGLPAAIMQGLLAALMFGMLQIFKLAEDPAQIALLSGSYGIYYKIMQMGLFACFGLSNTLITIVSFNYGMKNKERVIQAIKYGLINSIITALVITVLFQALATPISNLFGLSISDSGLVTKSQIINTCTIAIHIATIGYVFMGVSIAAQGILQGFNDVYRPVIIALFRLILFVFPIAIIFVLNDNSENTIWWTFVIAEVLTAVISLILLKRASNKYLSIIEE